MKKYPILRRLLCCSLSVAMLFSSQMATYAAEPGGGFTEQEIISSTEYSNTDENSTSESSTKESNLKKLVLKKIIPKQKMFKMIQTLKKSFRKMRIPKTIQRT